MAERNLTGMGVRLGVIVISLAMIGFMLQRRDLYPLWTVLMIAVVAVGTLVSLVRILLDS